MCKQAGDSGWSVEPNHEVFGQISDFELYRNWPSIQVPDVLSPPVGRERLNKGKHNLSPSPEAASKNTNKKQKKTTPNENKKSSEKTPNKNNQNYSMVKSFKAHKVIPRFQLP